MTTEELLRDYISYHYVEGNITNKQRVKMEFAAANYVQELKQLHIPVVARQSEQLKEKEAMSFDEFTAKYFYKKQGDVYYSKITDTFVNKNDIMKKYQQYCINF